MSICLRECANQQVVDCVGGEKGDFQEESEVADSGMGNEQFVVECSTLGTGMSKLPAEETKRRNIHSPEGLLCGGFSGEPLWFPFKGAIVRDSW